MTVSVRLALGVDRPRTRALLDDYLAELSRYGKVNRAYPWFDAYWQTGEPRWPYLIEHADGIAGFAFVNTHAPAGVDASYAMAEFYITPTARRHGTGRTAAAVIFQRHPGIWAVSIMRRNKRALGFWPRAIAEAGAGDVEPVDVGEDLVYRFLIDAIP